MNELLRVLIGFLTSEAGLNLLAWLLGIIFSAIFGGEKIKQWLKEAKIERLKVAFAYLEAAVIQNRELVDKMKKDNGGHLSEDQKQKLEQMVVDNLLESAKTTGVDAVNIIGPELIKPAIVYAVKNIKARVILPSKPMLSSEVLELFEDK